MCGCGCSSPRTSSRLRLGAAASERTSSSGGDAGAAKVSDTSRRMREAAAEAEPALRRRWRREVASAPARGEDGSGTGARESFASSSWFAGSGRALVGVSERLAEETVQGSAKTRARAGDGGGAAAILASLCGRDERAGVVRRRKGRGRDRRCGILDGKGTPPHLAASMFTPSFDARRERVDGIAATDPRANARGDLAARRRRRSLRASRTSNRELTDGAENLYETRRARDV